MIGVPFTVQRAEGGRRKKKKKKEGVVAVEEEEVGRGKEREREMGDEQEMAEEGRVR